MKKIFNLLLLFSMLFSMPLSAQVKHGSDVSIPKDAKFAEFGIVGGGRLHLGYLHKLDSTSIDILKQYNSATTGDAYANFQIPVRQLDYVVVYGAKKKVAAGALIGAGVGLGIGIIVIATHKNPACDDGVWYPGKIAEFGSGEIINLMLGGGCFVGGAVVGTIIGSSVNFKVSIPIHGDRRQYEAAKPQLLRYAIIKNSGS